MKIVSWNIAGSREPWRRLLDMDADIALLQEAGKPPPEVAACIDVNPGPWRTAPSGWHLPWRTAVVRLSKRVQVEWIETKAIEDAASGELAVSHPGTLAAATVTPPDGEPIVVVSMYAPWRKPHTSSSWIVSDASAHRVVSDLSLLIGRQQGHRIVAAGDLNILHGYGEGGSAYWAARYQTVFTRMEALGASLRRSAGAPRRPAGRPMAERATLREQGRPHVLFDPTEGPSCRDAPVGLRLRLQGAGPLPQRTRPQRARRVGPQRPLPLGDRGLVVLDQGPVELPHSWIGARWRSGTRGHKVVGWSGRLDSNQRPPAPHAGALPSCATPRPRLRVA